MCVGEYDIKTPIYALVEIMVEKNHSRLSIVVLLTTMICTQ